MRQKTFTFRWCCAVDTAKKVFIDFKTLSNHHTVPIGLRVQCTHHSSSVHGFFFDGDQPICDEADLKVVKKWIRNYDSIWQCMLIVKMISKWLTKGEAEPRCISISWNLFFSICIARDFSINCLNIYGAITFFWCWTLNVWPNRFTLPELNTWVVLKFQMRWTKFNILPKSIWKHQEFRQLKANFWSLNHFSFSSFIQVSPFFQLLIKKNSLSSFWVIFISSKFKPLFGLFLSLPLVVKTMHTTLNQAFLHKLAIIVIFSLHSQTKFWLNTCKLGHRIISLSLSHLSNSWQTQEMRCNCMGTYHSIESNDWRCIDRKREKKRRENCLKRLIVYNWMQTSANEGKLLHVCYLFFRLVLFLHHIRHSD